MIRPAPRARCVVVFTRTPWVEARAKRLPAAARLFACARARVLAAGAGSGADVLLSSPGPAGPAPAGVRLLPQRGAAFAERVHNAFADARARGYGEIVMVPGDVPGLLARHLRAAFGRLRSRSTVLGPSPDGGVYLLGIRGDFAPVLAGVPWRTRFVYARLAANAGRVASLAPLADVDGHRHLRALRSDSALDAELAPLVAALLARSATPEPAAAALPSDPHRSPLASRPPPTRAAA
jgi:2-phospho-L-lactate guanylyltransferase (CobY/MobA/RfbA family)